MTTSTPPLAARLGAEALGTSWLVLAGCGTAVLAGDRVGYAGIAAAFGLAVLTMAYAVGHVSGGHFNPAVTVGLACGRRFPWRDVPAYAAAQVAAASVAGGLVFVVARSRPGYDRADGLAANGFGAHSPAGFGLGAALVVEVVLTAMFLFVIMGATDRRAPVGFAPLAIGLTLTAIHLISIPVTNTSVNPARSLGVAWFAGNGALGQVWLFVLAPLVGAAIAGLTHAAITGTHREDRDITGSTTHADTAGGRA